MRLILALRLPSPAHVKALILNLNNTRIPRDTLVDVQIERRYPALKNMITFFNDCGILPTVRSPQPAGSGVKSVRPSDDRLLWCEIETDRPLSFWEALPEAEVILAKSTFEAFVASIRGRSGTAYIEACEQYARELVINVAPLNNFNSSTSGLRAVAM